MHWSITDNTGKSIILEYRVDTTFSVYKNSIHVITNAPNYDWHMTNLNNYVQLSKYERDDIKVNDELTITKMGMGSGLLGMPGNSTSSSGCI